MKICIYMKEVKSLNLLTRLHEFLGVFDAVRNSNNFLSLHILFIKLLTQDTAVEYVALNLHKLNASIELSCNKMHHNTNNFFREKIHTQHISSVELQFLITECTVWCSSTDVSFRF
jgi:hypothetical protein